MMEMIRSWLYIASSRTSTIIDKRREEGSRVYGGEWGDSMEV